MAVKRIHEIRDPLHDFVELDRQERALVDSVPFQRLRHINQLALTPLVYPGATHKRFEHSLGVMHLARKVFDVVTTNVHPKVEHIIPDAKNRDYWKSALSLAALAHDIGHLPFSHTAEKRLLPQGEDHENLSLELIASGHLTHIWGIGHYVRPEDVQKLAVGQKKLKGVEFTTWESILSEIITGDSFGVDRMDYLLRDSYHCGVSYGRFDHSKLISSLRILPKEDGEGKSEEPTLGVEHGGIHSAEALLLARYFMYEQVYFHPVRRIYDQHLIDFMVSHYGANGYSKDIAFHLSQTDNEVTAAIRAAVNDPKSAGHSAARAIMCREHHRLVYSFNPSDQLTLKTAIEQGTVELEIEEPLNSPADRLWKSLSEKYGKDNVKKDLYIQGASPALFPVIMPDGRIESSTNVSPILENFPLMTVDSVYVSHNLAEEARSWIGKNRAKVLRGEV
jgi:HD superfamily phosphohydrolase